MFSESSSELDLEQHVDALCDRFELAWTDGPPPDLGEYLDQAPPQLALRVLAELWAIELHHRRDADGRRVDDARLAEIHPHLAPMLAELPTLDGVGGSPVTWGVHIGSTDGQAPRTTQRQPGDGHPPAARRGPIDSRGLHIRCPHCSNAVELLADSPVDDVECESCGSQFSLVGSADEEGAEHTLETLGRFELLSRLGVGGFGTVWKARDTDLHRIVAVKIPRKGRLSTREVEQFLREARSAAQLRHPNIVPVFEVGREGDVLFIVSEFVRGVTLSDWAARTAQPPREAAEICAVLADALHCAHSEGVVHRDLKPSNVMLDLARRPRLMDFGLAKRDAGEVTMTMDGQVLGTPAYMSPEQARGHGHWTDRRTDVYSLGVMLFELLTGELPFRGNAAAQIQRRLSADPPNPRTLNRGVPADLATICLKCMELDPNRRYQAAAEVADELRRFLDNRPIYARPLSKTGHALRWARRKPALASALMLGAILAIVGPAAAIAIGVKNDRIQTQLNENVGLIKQAEKDKARLSRELAAVEDKLTLLTGGDPDNERQHPWREELVRKLIGERHDLFQQEIDAMPAGRAKAQAQLGLARLLAAAGRPTQAAPLLEAAFNEPSLSTDERRKAGLQRAEILLDQKKPAEARAVLETLLTGIDGESLAERLDQLHGELLKVSARPDDLSPVASRLEPVEQAVHARLPQDATGLYEAAELLLGN